VDAALVGRTRSIAAIGRLMTVPGIGSMAATTLYAWVGDVGRFPNAKALAAYAGLVPSVRQSGGAAHYGEITKQGAKALRATLVQAGRASGVKPCPTLIECFHDRAFEVTTAEKH
jgi:transposase